MYLKKTWVYKNHIEVRKYHTSRYGVKGEKRIRRGKPSEESVKAANERNSVRKLTRLLINNFDSGDWHLVLTYSPDERPDPEGARAILQKFFSRLRREYKKRETELKYITVTEWMGKSIHHHIVISDCPEFSKVITAAWPYGGKHMTPLYPDQDFGGLAEYLVKETSKTFRDPESPYRQRYSCSRNLKKPEEKTEVIRASEWKKLPTVSKALTADGYVLDKESVYEGLDIFGYPFMEYRYVRRHRGKDGPRDSGISA